MVNFRNSDQPPPPIPPHAHLLFQQAFTTVQNHFSNFLQQHRQPRFSLSLLNPLKTLSYLQSFPWDNPIGRISSTPSSRVSRSPVWGRIAEGENSRSSGSLTLSMEDIEERLAGVPVYALSNSFQEFVLLSGVNTGKSLGLFCFKEEDAETLLAQMKSMDPEMRQGSRVVPVALNKVFQLKVDGVAFRLIPESSQIKNALKERQKAGFFDESFSGVPVFQSKSLILRSEKKRYRPVFFRKEDLEKSLLRASREQKLLNPAFREGDIQVAVLEDIIRGMKDSTTSTWDDVVFIPPGFDVSTDSYSKR